MSFTACNIAERLRRPASWMLGFLWLAALAATASTWPLHGATHELIEELGALLVGLCIAGRVYCTLYIAGHKNGRLVREGPYSVSRNPLYFFSLLGVAGVGMSSGALTLGVVFAGSYFGIVHLTVLSEEQRLLANFGDAYRAYLREVPRWIPALTLWRDANVVTVQPALVARRFVESAGLLLAMPLVELLEQLHAASLLPVVLTLP